MEADLKAGHCVDPDREMQEPDILSPSRRGLCRAQSVERRYQRIVDQAMLIFFFLVSVWVGAVELGENEFDRSPYQRVGQKWKKKSERKKKGREKTRGKRMAGLVQGKQN